MYKKKIYCSGSYYYCIGTCHCYILCCELARIMNLIMSINLIMCVTVTKNIIIDNEE